VGVQTRNDRALSAEQVESFERDGYLVLDDPCPGDLVDALNAEFEQRFQDELHPGPEYKQDGVLYRMHPGLKGNFHWQRIMDAWRISDNARAIATSPPVLSLLETLYGRAPRPFQTLNFPVGTQQPAHSDAMFFDGSPAGFMCGVWIALEDVDADNGPLVYYPGSHKLPTPTIDVIEEAIGERLDPAGFETVRELRDERSRQYSAYCRLLIEKHDLQPQYGTIRKGQAMIWSSNLLHGGAKQHDRARTRLSQVTHYLFEDVRLQRPIWSESGLTYWDYPVWVREPPIESGVAALRKAVTAHVPAGSNVVVMTQGDDSLLDIPGRTASPFPQDEAGAYLPRAVAGEEALSMLEALRAAGSAQFMVLTPAAVRLLQAQALDLLHGLETRHRAVFIDGAVGGIYDLR
jgi:ectoine hydroxylase-related dioxygenase (phytanoyl-CoA dioxygenase family)